MPRAGKLVSLLLKTDALNIGLFPEQIYLVLNLILCFRHHWLICSHASNNVFSSGVSLSCQRSRCTSVSRVRQSASGPVCKS